MRRISISRHFAPNIFSSIMHNAAKLPALALCACLLPVLSCNVQAQASAPAMADEQQIAAIDSLMQAAYPSGGPGASLIVVTNGHTLMRKSFGMSNIESGTSLTPDSIFEIGSVTKQFTAVALLLLEQRGKLSLQDPIGKYLPDYPSIGMHITIEQLLTHTSGIGDPISAPEYWDKAIKLPTTPDGLVKLIGDTPQVFAPGAQFKYNNSGYMLAGVIIEKVSGQSYADFIQKNILQVLGLSNTRYGGRQLIPARATGYTLTPDGFANAAYINMSQPYAAGALMTNVDDLARWNEGLFSGKLIKQSALDRMTMPYRLSSGELSNYGYGFELLSLRGSPAFQHSGVINGFTTYIASVPSKHSYVALLTNRDPSESPPLAINVGLKVAAIALGKPFPDRAQVPQTPGLLDQYSGQFKMADGTTWRVWTEEDALFVQPPGGTKLPLKVADGDVLFFAKSVSYIEAIRDTGGKVSELRVHRNGDDNFKSALR